jgi:hypothetical protein
MMMVSWVIMIQMNAGSSGIKEVICFHSNPLSHEHISAVSLLLFILSGYIKS